MDITRSILMIYLVFLFSTQNYFMFSLGMNIICKESERRALLSFKQDLNDPEDGLSSWSGKNCCKWARVVCSNRTHHVVQLHLQGFGLGGKLNPSLQELKQLRHLDLSFNKFEGIIIPDFMGSLQSLRYLNLSGTGFSGMIPHQLGSLSKLRYLDISQSNYFYEGLNRTVAGNNLQWLSHLSSLQHLDMSGVTIKNASNCLHAISTLPSLLVLRLSDCGLSGALPSLSHVNFTSLAVLVLQNNKINSSLPEWLYSLTNLEQLDISQNSLRGTISVSLGNLTKLTLLDLSYNSLEGKIPITIEKLCKLQSLNLQDNQLSGQLPSELGRLGNLTSLVLTDNKLNGHVPKSLGNLSNLIRLSITGNAIEGVISEVHFANMTRLQSLYMDSLVLKMSPEWVPPFQLLYADLSTCQLGPGFPIWLRTQKFLTYLDLSRTGISGTVPTWFWNLPFNNFFYVPSLDELNGELPKLLNATSINLNSSQPSKYTKFDLSHNELNGELPKVLNLTRINLSSNQFNGQLPLVTDDVQELDLSNNSFSGRISDFLCNPISEHNSLSSLDLSDNFLSGDLSDCWVYWTSLYTLRLAGNKITGKIQSSMGSLINLEELHLSNNNISGELPSSLRNCASLKSIDLGGNGFTGKIPIWLGESLSLLLILRLRSNQFYGRIPLELCNLASLRVLDIAHNDLRGTIPRCFNKFSAMKASEESEDGNGFAIMQPVLDETTLVMKGRALEYDSRTLLLVTSLDLSKNSLSGEIPEELTSLLELQSLNLSENRFTGKIPEKIGNMVLLESLDLSKNRISGAIPQSISGLHFLGTLNLSYNNLSGKIPLSTQLQSFNQSSYIGNGGLCGPPLGYCNGEEPPQKPGDVDGEVEDDVWFEMKWFYMSMGVGFAIGFWTFWGVMVLKRSWRIAYFRFLDDVKDKLCLLF